jgi:hypothetical protein
MKKHRGTPKQWAEMRERYEGDDLVYNTTPERRVQSLNISAYQAMGVHTYNSSRGRDLCAV